MFALWCRKLRNNYPRSYFAPLYGLDERAIRISNKVARSHHGRSWCYSKQWSSIPFFMREVARDARDELAALDEARSNRNFNR